MKKSYIKGSIILVIIILISYVYVINNSSPLDPIQDIRGDIAENHKLIDIERTELGTMVYWVGKVNNGADNMYFADMVEKTLKGYKWVGGGGHINRDIGKNNDFIFSAQLLNEDQNVRPTIFGILLDKKIKNITLRTTVKEPYNAVIYDDNNESEQFYYIPLYNNDTNYNHFMFIITYENGERKEFIITPNENSKFQQGNPVYFYEN